MRTRILNFPLDIFGILASLLCAIHCLALPILLSVSSLAFLDFLGNQWIEYSVIILSIVIAFYSLLPNYKQHRKITPLVIVLTGFLLIAIGQSEIFKISELAFTFSGAIFIALAHSFNWRILIKFKNK